MKKQEGANARSRFLFWSQSGLVQIHRRLAHSHIDKSGRYDWKGRPTLTANSDGTTRVASYGGCGCAGGEATTLQDEHGRQKRLTQDGLGRLSQVEELDWNGIVYETTTYSYNALFSPSG